MVRCSLLLFFAVIFSLSIKAQDIRYSKSILDTLCSPGFHGRGYALKGHIIAAEYLQSELQKHHIKGFNGKYLQSFSFPVNTFPSDMEVIAENDTLIPGIDFLVDPSSGSCSGTFPLKLLNKEILLDTARTAAFLHQDLTSTFVLIDTSGVVNPKMIREVEAIAYFNLFKAKGIIYAVDGKLTHGISREEKSFAMLSIKRGKIEHASFITLSIKNKFIKNCKSQNILAYLGEETDSFIVFTAHYDHLGMMGATTYFPGANDNGSGVSMVMDLARHYSDSLNRGRFSIAIFLFSAEEVGLLGSSYYAENPVFPLSKIKILINLDLVGTGEEGIKVVNGGVFKDDFARMVSINDSLHLLAKVSPRGEAANSDHYPFYVKGVKSFFIYTLGGIAEYHNVLDKAETLPFTEYEDVFRLLIDFVKSYE